MEMIDFRHAVNQIIRRFWVIVLAAFLGIVLSALFFFVFEKREPETTQVSETKKAYFMLAMTKDARQNFSSGNILDYTVSMRVFSIQSIAAALFTKQLWKHFRS